MPRFIESRTWIFSIDFWKPMRSVVILNVLFDIVFTLKILIYSAPLGFSHIRFMGTIADILHEGGHDVTVLHPVAYADLVHEVSKKSKRVLVDMPESLRKKFDIKEMGLWNITSKSIMGQLEMAIFFSNLQQESCEYLVGINKTMSLLREEHFDVGISEVLTPCGFGLFELINIPHMIGASATGVIDSMNEFVEVPIMPSFMPAFMSSYDECMTFPQRFINFFLHGAIWLVTNKEVYEYEMIFKRHGLISNLPKRVLNKTNYLLSNSDEFLEYSWPTSSKLVYIGGIALPEATPLEEEFRLMMDRPDSKGVVLIAFGASVLTVQMPNNIRAAILEAVSTFQNYTFIWKIDKDDKLPEMANLFTPRWVPQTSLLRHPNLRCFISHAGMNSVLELTRNGKPAILIPLFADHYRNAKLVERRGSAIILYTETFTSEKFIEGVHSILEDDKYQRRAKRLSSLMNRKPFKLKERLLSTVEFSAMHGKIEELDVYSYRMGTIQYFCLDVILVAFSLVVLSFYAVAYCIWKSSKHIFNGKNKID